MPGFTTRNGVNYNYIWYGVILESTRTYNEDMTEVVDLLTQPANEQYVSLMHRGQGAYQEMASLEMPDQVSIEHGRLRPSPRFYGIGKGYTWPYLVDATDEDIMEHEAALQFFDRDFMRKSVFTPLYVVPGTDQTHFGMYDGNFKTDENLSAPPPIGVLTFTASHTHYVGTGSPLASGVMLEDISAMKKHIREHGHRGRLILFLSEKNMNQLELLALPIIDRTRHAGGVGVTGGSGQPVKAFIENPLSQEVLTSGMRGNLLGVDLVETNYAPDDYLLMCEVDAAKGMFYQQKDNPMAKGLIQFPGNSEYPIVQSKQFRWHKFGVRRRSFAVVYQIGVAAASYSSPSPYSGYVY